MYTHASAMEAAVTTVFTAWLRDWPVTKVYESREIVRLVEWQICTDV